MTAAPQTAVSSIDAHLGPRQGRFFGDGFRRVEHRVTQMRIDRGDVTATAHVRYPGDWSKKRHAALRPHLSSVDALVLAVQLAEAHLTHRFALTVDERRAMRLRSVDIRSGRAPQEELDSVALRAHLTRSLAVRARQVSSFDCTVGGLSVACAIEHAAGAPTAAPGSYATLGDVLGPSDRRYYGDGYKALPQTIAGVDVSADGRTVRATVTLPRPARDLGLGGAYQPAASMVDGLVCLAQLAQVLAYRLDGIERGRSHTLWMRRLAEVAQAPAESLSGPVAAAVWLQRTRVVAFGGGRWRTLDVGGRLGPITARSSIAHQLPSER